MSEICLGIESTAHTFGIGIVDEEGNILYDEKSFYEPPVGEGLTPRKVFEYHAGNVGKIVKGAISREISVVAFSQGPGLPNCLSLGATIARYLSLKLNLPLVGVNHCLAHIEIAKMLTKCKDPVVVYCSGGNTQILALVDGRYRIFGETLDIPIGNAFDMLARILGLSMPGGPKIEELAKSGKWVELPYVVKGMDFSFSGIVTECEKLCKKSVRKEDIAYSFQETCFSMITEATERALAHTEKNEVLVTGGVAANRRFNEMLEIMCKDRGAKLYSVPIKYAGDNGVMIAWTGMKMFKTGITTRLSESQIKKDWRVDEVDVKWT
ncbi:MAG: KEOPS complex N(6)-L-threonylcarbamoyladenine synthase Kae1 [Candidatus Aenigmarchaeota archaeon]|nr:KEOPS complex N(6)-L-threonylcarbamoyladenine synthase Kae1 [Candidatus Aenigmarchaeota archaeon]